MWNISPQRGHMQFLANFMSPIEANIILGRMLSEGIRARIIDEGVIWNNYMYSHALGGVKLLVHHSDRKRAEEILSKIDDNEYLLDEKKPDPEIPVSTLSKRPFSVLANSFLVILLFLIIGIALPLKI
ncbi:conserved hypothetical protein [Xenorhabdus cabanillasii JM26]|uniref:Uncharacterized protein n=2 Tax=Xenorhabdus cabanillasii TaxID=351673 RepID=W1JBD0_9GAMM|nr:hypothetical protein Xcab_02957 [Xenorhabdus cabanillasii JM26]CDL86810.1 conserved hypothetical protein [Xenorhabdus cabanillasii JM26]